MPQQPEIAVDRMSDRELWNLLARELNVVDAALMTPSAPRTLVRARLFNATAAARELELRARQLHIMAASAEAGRALDGGDGWPGRRSG